MLSGLLEALDGDPAVDIAVSDEALVRAMLDVEAALARALERAGRVPAGTGRVVTDALAGLRVDPGDLGRRGTAGNPVVPLVADALAAVPEDASIAVHLGATSQDILDTALMLCARRTLEPLLRHLVRATDAAARLTDRHRRTLMLARTLGQPALPTTFGLKAAGWLAGLSVAHQELTALRDVGLVAQLGGAAGTLAGYGDDGLDVARLLAEELDLTDPGTPWHTQRSPVHRLAAALASVTTATGKVATDVLLMSQAEIGEVAEGSPGDSSAMPHKRNPVASVLLVSAARRAPGLVGTVLTAGLHEHERATGSWHAEWVPLRDLLRLAGGAAARVADLLEQLRVAEHAMRRNLDAATPGVLSEAVAGLLIPALGRTAAQQVARRATAEANRRRCPLAEAVATDPDVAALVSSGALDPASVQAIGDPAGYLGAADRIIDRALAVRPVPEEPDQ